MAQHELFNRKNKKQLIQELKAESFDRKTCSFYRYVKINEPVLLRDKLYQEWKELGILGRIYLADEGINAQISVPEPNWEGFKENLQGIPEFMDVPFKMAVDSDNHSFLKLIIRVKDKIVADGFNDATFDSANVGKHLNAAEFNAAMEEPDSVVVDMRNYYESEVGHFENAVRPDVDTFKEALPIVKDLLSSNKEQKILLYCTGGIRCEKASAYLKHHEFKDVNQLYGGIIDYTHKVKQQGLEQRFIGKNFVFDSRMGEEITDDVISNCHQCEDPSNFHTNCRNQACHILFIQCGKCAENYNGCCSDECAEIAAKPLEEQLELRKYPAKAAPLKRFQDGVKPKLRELVKKNSIADSDV